jgi:4-hydroxy-3-polyprenylbenzoate decarboxylase
MLEKTRRLVVGISGSSGAILGIRLLEALKATNVETHLVVTSSASLTITQETHWKVCDVLALADFQYSDQDMAARIASGSFITQGMVVIPCSVKTLSAVANSAAGNLLARAADVTLKEGRPLLLVLREAPLHRGHLRLMEQAAEAGAVIFPPVPAFYTNPKSVDGMLNNIVGRVLLRLGIENDLYAIWQGAQQPELRLREDRRIPQELLAIAVMTLATNGNDGAPHAASVYFAGGGQSFYFFSAPDSQHAHDLQANPQAAVTISPLVEGWREIIGLQMRGRVRILPPGEEWSAAWQVYRAKFPFAQGLQAEISRNQLYEFTPAWLRLVDNSRGMGFKEEWIFP